jgi:hypothetical protein
MQICGAEELRGGEAAVSNIQTIGALLADLDIAT